MSLMIELEHLSKTYSMPGEDVHALQDINLSIEEGEFLAIMGRSGCGKTTLLNILGTLLPPTSGIYRLKSQEISGMKAKEICAIRRKEIGFIFQHYRLLKEYSVWENICMPMILDQKKPDKEYLQELAQSCGIYEKLTHYPDQLSGGEQQRVAIVRAMAHKPSILLADEPTGNLDYNTGQNVMAVLASCRRHYHQTVVMVTHDNECASYADKILVMADGKILK